jgi:hypothetical protein
MTPSEHIDQIEELINKWHVPLYQSQTTLMKGLESMDEFKLEAKDVPLIIKLVENPKYDIGLFAGNVSLHNHDCIHLLLGRGLRVKDEAFVIGYTMGSTKKMWRWRKNLYMFCAKYLFPDGYSFGEEERFVFNMGVMAGVNCPTDLSKQDFKKLENKKLKIIREELGLDKQLLKDIYRLEKKCFPDSKESQRLL